MATLAAIPSPGKFPKSLNTKSVTPPSFSWAAGVHYRETCLSPRKGGDVPKSLNPNLTPIPKGKCPLPVQLDLQPHFFCCVIFLLLFRKISGYGGLRRFCLLFKVEYECLFLHPPFFGPSYLTLLAWKNQVMAQIRVKGCRDAIYALLAEALTITPQHCVLPTKQTNAYHFPGWPLW